MIVQLKNGITEKQLKSILKCMNQYDLNSTAVHTKSAHYLVAIGRNDIDIRQIGALPGVTDVHRVSDPYKLVSRKWKVLQTEIDISDDVKIDAGGLTLMAGPCAIESEEQIKAVIRHLQDNKIRIMRGGVFKPRTSPYSFQGAGLEGLKMWSYHARAAGIKIISEVLSVDQIASMYEYIDIFQVGTRNAQNFSLLHALGEIDKPVLIKRGMSGTLEDLLHAAEYVFSNGNEALMLCERGIRTFERAYRNTLDLNAVPLLKEKTHLPVLVDPSHGVGIRRFVEPMALAAIAAGCDGIIFEVHKHPEQAISDAQQTLDFSESRQLIEKVRVLKYTLQQTHPPMD